MNRKKKISKYPLTLSPLHEDQSDTKMAQLNLFGSKVALNIIKSPRKALIHDIRVSSEPQESKSKIKRYFNLNSINKRNNYDTSHLFQGKTSKNSGTGSIFSKSRILKSFEISPKSNKSTRSPAASKSRIRIFREKVENLMKV